MGNRSSRLLLALLAAAVACSRQSSGAFTQSVAESLKAASRDAEVAVVGPLQVAVTPKNGKRTSLDLTELWKSCGGKPDCGEPVERYVRSVVAGTLVVEAPAKREYLRPLIRVRSNLSPAEAAAVSEPLVGDLVIVYVLDSGDARRPVAPADLQALGLDKAGLRAAAVANLEAAAPDIPHEPSDAPRVFVVRTADGYAASRLLLHKRWEALKAEVAGDLLVVVPHQRVMFFTGSGEDKATRDRMKALAADRMDGADGLSPTVLKWTPEGWVPFAG
jgi:hypothetical protein